MLQTIDVTLRVSTVLLSVEENEEMMFHVPLLLPKSRDTIFFLFSKT